MTSAAPSANAVHTKARKPLQPVALDKWVENTRRLLVRERDEEVSLVQQELATLDDAQNPNVLTHLRVVQSATALFGRTMLQFAFPSAHVHRPKPHQFTVGDLVQIRLKAPRGSDKDATTSSSSSHGGARKYPTGIVARVDDSGISVALGENEDLDEHELLASSHAVTLDRLVNTATFTKISSALDQLSKFNYGAAQAVVDIVFTGRSPSWNPLPVITPFSSALNESQLEAIRFALASKDLALIHGPPGTGKTTTVVELIRQAVATFKLKVLVCAPSNIAVDNVLEKLASADAKLQLTRVGHPARLLPQVLRHCLDARIAAADGTEIVHDIRKEIASMQSRLSKTRDKAERFQLRRELKANRKEIRQREQNVVRELLKHSDVVFATNVGAASKLLQDMTFDLVVIDEAAQALEASCWIPLLKAPRCVLAGDHLQLPPTIKCKVAAASGLELTLFDRVTRFAHTQSVVKMLTTQYRMHEAISDWSSHAMYSDALHSAESVAHRKLHELPHVSIRADDELLNATLLLIDTAGCGLDEDDDNDSSDGAGTLKLSKSNAGEARVVAKHVRALLQVGLQPSEVAVITPYNKQVQVLKALLLETFPQLEIRSVDGFQGCEKEAVVMSLVRSNAARAVGFLADDRRMNVAITRAKRHVAVVCDTDTIRAHAFLDALVEHFEARGEYRSAQEYLDDDLVHGSADDDASVAVAAAASSIRKPATTSARSDAKAASGKSKSITTTARGEKPSPKSSRGELLASKQVSAVAVAEQAASATTSNAGRTKTDDADSEEDDDDLEAKSEPPAVTTSASVFQLVSTDSDSDSSESDKNKDEDDDDDRVDATQTPSDLDSANSLLKDLHLARMARQPAPPAPSSSNKKSKKSKTKKANASKPAATTAPVATLRDGEDELAFLERQAKSSTKCSFQGTSRCKKSTTVMGSLCRFCKLKFCYDHGLPEVHGCGDAVCAFARAQFQQQQQRPSSSSSAAASAKPLSADKRKLLKKKLEEKVTAKTADRTTKTNGKAKDKK